MTNMKRTNLEVAGGLLLSASGYVIRWWQTRNDVPNAVKKANAAKDKEHAEGEGDHDGDVAFRT